jgi:putative heme-binding domain-containing protein
MIGKKASRDNLFESILYPSKAIADQYVTWNIETKQGVTVSGLLIEETKDHVLLRDANGKDTKIPIKEIDTRTKSLVSIMPADLLAYMTEDELVDVVEYLMTLKTPMLALDYWHIIGPFDNGANDAGLDQVFPPEKQVDLKATYAGKRDKVSWRIVKPNAQGYVDLQEHYAGQSTNIVSYLFRAIESPVDQEATILLGADDGSKLWINDQQVFSNRDHDAAQPERYSVPVKLKKGKNKILFKINNGNDPHGFYLSIQSEQELKRLESK